MHFPYTTSTLAYWCVVAIKNKVEILFCFQRTNILFFSAADVISLFEHCQYKRISFSPQRIFSIRSTISSNIQFRNTLCPMLSHSWKHPFFLLFSIDFQVVEMRMIASLRTHPSKFILWKFYKGGCSRENMENL